MVQWVGRLSSDWLGGCMVQPPRKLLVWLSGWVCGWVGRWADRCVQAVRCTWWVVKRWVGQVPGGWVVGCSTH